MPWLRASVVKNERIRSVFFGVSHGDEDDDWSPVNECSGAGSETEKRIEERKC